MIGGGTSRTWIESLHIHTHRLFCVGVGKFPLHTLTFPLLMTRFERIEKKAKESVRKLSGPDRFKVITKMNLIFFLSFFCALVVPRNWYFFSGHVPPPQVLKEAKRGKKKREWKWKCVQSLCGSISEWSKGRFEARGVFRRIFLLCWKRNFIYEPADMSGRGREREE